MQQNKDILKKSESSSSLFHFDSNLLSQTFVPLLNKWHQENSKIQKNVSENQSIFSQIQMIVSEQNRLIQQLQLQIAKQNEKENEYINCKKKLQQTEEYVNSLIKKHNQTVYELNQQILKLKDDHNQQIQQIQNKYETQTNHSRVSSSFSSSAFSSAACSVSSSPSCSAVNNKKILLSKQNTMPISTAHSSLHSCSHLPKYKSLDNIDSKLSEYQILRFAENVNNIADSYPLVGSNSKITIIQPRISKSSSRRNSLKIENLHLANKNKTNTINNVNTSINNNHNTNMNNKNDTHINNKENNDPNKKSFKLRKTKSEIMQNNFFQTCKKDNEYMQEINKINNEYNNDNNESLGIKCNRYSTPIRKSKSLSFSNYEAFKTIKCNKTEINKGHNDHVATINIYANDLIYDNNDNNTDSNDNTAHLGKELDNIQEDLMETMSQNSDVSY